MEVEVATKAGMTSMNSLMVVVESMNVVNKQCH